MRFRTQLLLPAIILTLATGLAAQVTVKDKPRESAGASGGSGSSGVSHSSGLTTDIQSEASQQIKLEVGQTRLLHISDKVIRVSVAEPTVSDVQVVTPKQVLITAKSVGYTHLILWGVTDEPLVIAVSVTRNLDELRSQINALFPDETITVGSVGDLVVLSGTVSDLRIPARAAEVAALHSERLANLIQVSGDQQVQLDVRFAEVSRSGLRKAGLNFLWSDAARGYVSGYSSASAGQYLNVPGTGGALPPVPAPPHSDAFNFFFSTGLAQFPFSAMLSILSQEGLAKMLAEPTLVAMSGRAAEFHAGGEVPLILTSTLGNTNVTFKKFGIVLKFTPTVLGERTMSLKVAVEVSEPDASSSVNLGSTVVPGFKTRSSDTTIRMKDGQSFAIAGLLSDSVRSTVSKVPFFGDIPILGMLFRSNAYRRDETELLMVVTAHLVRPLRPDEVPFLPGEDFYNDPRDVEFFLMGTARPKKTAEAEKKDEQQKRKQQGTTARSAQSKQDRTLIAKTADGSRLQQGPAGPVGFIRQ